MDEDWRGALLFFKFDGGNLVKMYHSSKFLGENVGYAVLDPPKESFFRSLLDYYPYKYVKFSIYTNDIEKSVDIYTQYIDYVEERLETTVTYRFMPYHSEHPNIFDALTDFNRQFKK